VTGFPWREAMQVGFGVMRLSSREFWALTPRELAAAFEGVSGRTTMPPARAALERMMVAYPDGERTRG
jgi:uncharacterized phage protein (TIGR02216 family)